jgi:L-lactate dehydrogenase complex protein LldG
VTNPVAARPLGRDAECPALAARFAEAFRANAGACHGPYPPQQAAEAAAALAMARSAGRPIAVATGDALLTGLSFLAGLRALGAEVLRADDPRWRERIGDVGVGVTAAIRGLAATGTVGLACGPGSPRATSLVPPAHVCLLSEADLVNDLSEALDGISPLPSALTWISGPSRSADLEMTLTLGVHGPATVDVVIVARDRHGNGDPL